MSETPLKVPENELAKQHFLETYRSMTTHGAGVLKMMALLNGGAAVALLAFLGHTWGNLTRQAPNVTGPMAAFVAGLVFCGLAAGTVYLTQFALYRQELYPNRPPRVWWRRNEFWLTISVVFIVLSWIAFGVGAVLALIVFNR